MASRETLRRPSRRGAADRRSCRRLRARLPSAGASRKRARAAARRYARQVRAQRLHPHRSRRQDDARHAAGRDGPGRLYRARDDPRRRTRCRFLAGRAGARAAERQALRQSAYSAFRPPAIPIPSGHGGSRCARPARRRARCWCRPPRSNGRSIRQAAPRRTAGSFMRRAGGRSPTALWSMRRARCSAAATCRRSKIPKNFVLIGKPLKRLDTPDKVNGKAVYGIDAMLPGMKFATIAACPVLGGKVAHVDDSAAKTIPGVQKVVVLDDLVAVVGDHMWAAKKGLDALDRHLERRPECGRSARGYLEELRAASKKDGAVAKSRGDIAKGLATGEQIRGRIRTSVSRACDDGADELHGTCSRPARAKSGPARRS